MADNDTHPMDEALGEIHEIALWLEMNNESELAERLAKAHEAIQNYLIAKDL